MISCIQRSTFLELWYHFRSNGTRLSGINAQFKLTILSKRRLITVISDYFIFSRSTFSSLNNEWLIDPNNYLIETSLRKNVVWMFECDINKRGEVFFFLLFVRNSSGHDHFAVCGYMCGFYEFASSPITLIFYRIKHKCFCKKFLPWPQYANKNFSRTIEVCVRNETLSFI